MAKGTRSKKTKWVSLSLANTATSVALPGSDSEQQPHDSRNPSQHHQHPPGTGGGHHRKNLHEMGTQRMYSSGGKEPAGAADSSEEHHSNETLDTQSGTRTDTSGCGSGSGSGSDCANGNSTERRTGAPYHKRRPAAYHTRASWAGAGTGNVAGGRGTYRSSGYYNSGGYYGSGRRSYYDTHSRRTANASGTNKTTSGEGDGEGGGGGGGGGAGRTTINDDEYTRITTPRQDVLFKKGYLSRPKPGATATTTTATATASTSNETTATSSIAGTTSEGSDGGGNGGGSNSISTTASITSEFGGSYAADGSPLFDYPYSLLPCGYFTENGVLVMNGFAVDNNGYSYFNGGQTYIYPPNFTNCQQPPPASTDVADPSDPIPLREEDETAATNPVSHDLHGEGDKETSEDGITPAHAPMRVDIGDGAVSVAPPADGETLPMMLSEVEQPTVSTESKDSNAEAGPDDVGVLPEGEVPVPSSQEANDYENGFYQFSDGYDFAQFYSSIYYPNWLMEQYRMYDDAGAPMYGGTGEYALPNGDVYTHQTSFKRRKKRFRPFEENTGENGLTGDADNMCTAVQHDGNQIDGEVGTAVPHEYQLNVNVQEFQPCTVVAAPLQNGEKVSSSAAEATQQPEQNHSPRVTKKPPAPVATKLPKVTASAVSGTTPVAPPRVVPAALSQKIRKKDLIESTLAFAEQNIDLTRSKAFASGSASLADSELDCWTTIDRNGRKKRQEQKPVDVGKEKEERSVHAAPKGEQRQTVLEKVDEPLRSSSSATTAPEAAASSVGTAAVVTQQPADISNKTDRLPAKGKKKTKPNKRQQHRKSGGGLYKQTKQEGFQLIEPEFPAVPTGGRYRTKGACDSIVANDDQLEEADEEEEGVHQLSEESVEGVCLPEEMNDKKDEEHVAEVVAPTVEVMEEEQTTSAELNCDEANEMTVPVSGPLPAKHWGLEVNEVQREAQDLVLATPPPCATVAMEEEHIVVKKTEKTLQQQVQPYAEDPKPLDVHGQSSEPALSAVHGECGPLVEPSSIVASRAFVEEPEVPEDTKLERSEPQQAAVDEQHQPEVEVCTARTVLTGGDAAKHLSFGDRPALLLPEEKLNVVERHGDAAGSDEDESQAGKRGSLSGGTYTESIDSGLQSPVSPCGGVASPEASSMVSSIESDDREPIDGPPQSEAPISQIVAKWLLQKLEVHELEEVFVLPTDPFLRQRLERFQLLQRREEDSFSSESDADDDLDGDSDSDYMSDGQGKSTRDRNACGLPINPFSGRPSATEHDVELLQNQQQQQQLNQAKLIHPSSEEEVVAPMKASALSPSDSRSINSVAGATRGDTSASSRDSKRCTIM